MVGVMFVVFGGCVGVLKGHFGDFFVGCCGGVGCFPPPRGGEVGAGKTTLCRALLEELGANFSTALILNPVLDADQLVKAVAMEFGLDVKGADRLEMVAIINDFLLRQMAEDRETVLIIDEA